MKTKNKVLAIALAVGLGMSSVSAQATGIPVYDGGNSAQMVQQLAHNVQMLARLKSQLDQMRQQYRAMTGSRGFGNLLTAQSLQQALPQDWQQIYQAIQSGGYDSLDARAKAIADAAGMIKRCEHLPKDSPRQKSCQAAAVQSAQTQSNITQALEATSRRLDGLITLASKIDGAKDIKAVQDLTARINIEQAAIQNEQNRIQLFFRMADEQKETTRQQERRTRNQRHQEVDNHFLGK